MSKERPNRTSFQELAKMASMPPTPAPGSVSGSQTPPPPSATGVLRAEEANSTDSGIVDLKAIATADPSGAHRAQSTPLASQGLFDEEHAAAAPASLGAPPTSSAAPAAVSMSGAPSPASMPAQAAAQAAPQVSGQTVKSAKDALATEKKKGSGGVLIVLGTLVAVGAIAAGAFFFVKWQHAHQASVAMNSTAADTAAAATAKAGTPAASASVAQADDTEVDDNAVDITNAAPGSKPTYHRHVKANPTATTAEAPPPATSGGVDPKLIANVPTGAAGGGSGDLSEAMKAAAGGGTGLGQGSDSQQGPKYAPGSVPQRPSQGQVQGAIGEVMPSVKACLGSDDPVSRANVVFESDGKVKSVSVSGFAAGKPQEACIKSALMKAKVDPFAEASYSIPVSIRP